MAKTEVDLVELASAVSAAILQFAQPAKEPDLKEDTTKKKKRGRPAKIKEETKKVESNKNEVESNISKPFEIQHGQGDKKRYCKVIPFEKKTRQNKFHDNLKEAAGDLYGPTGKRVKDLYPPPIPRRETQQLHTYICKKCNKSFQAFESYLSYSLGSDDPNIVCYDCNSRTNRG